MTLISMAGLVLIVGASTFILAGPVAPRLYSEPDLDKREQIIKASPRRWLISQLMFAVGTLFYTLGYLLMALELQGHQAAWPLIAGSVLLIGGAVSALYFIYRQTLAPRWSWESSGSSGALLITGLVVTLLSGIAFMALAFLQGPIPDWLGVASLIYVALSVLAIWGLRVPTFLVILAGQILFITTGIVILTVT